MDDDLWAEEAGFASTQSANHNNYSNSRPPQRNDMNWRSERGTQQRNCYSGSYKQNNTLRTGERRMNMDNEESCEILIDNSFVGKVIGRGGSKIRELQDESKAYIKILENESGAGDTSIRLSGSSEAIEKAKILIEDLISSNSNSASYSNHTTKSSSNYIQPSDNESFDWNSDAGSHRQNNSTRAAGMRMNMGNEESSEMLIDNSFVGKVIGKGGSKIREMQDESKAYIKILENDSGSAETCVRLSGSSEAIEKAKVLIEDLISGGSNLASYSNYTTKSSSNYMQSSDNETFDWNCDTGSHMQNNTTRAGGMRMNMGSEESSEMLIDNSFVGKIIGKGGSKIRDLQDESKAYIKILENDTGAADTCVRLSGSSEAIEKAKVLIEDLISGASNLAIHSNYTTKSSSNYMQSSDNETSDWNCDTGSHTQNNTTRAGGMRMNAGSEESAEMLIDNSFVGKVIGKGGSKIRELQDESKAYIKILENDSGSAETCVRLSGSSEAIEKAKVLIEDLISGGSNQASYNNYATKSSSNYMQTSDNEPFDWNCNTGSFKQNDTFRAGGRKMNMDNEETSEMLIDNSFVGKVIGKGGSKIRELQDESKAYIKILENDSGAADTCVRLSGSSEAIGKAKILIEDLISGGSNQASYSNYATKSSSNYIQPSDNEPFDWAGLLKKSQEAKLKHLASLPPIIKDFYAEDPKVASMNSEEIEKFRRENNSISVMKIDPADDRKIPNPVTSFKQAFHNYPELLEELRKQGFTAPSPIQCQAWPILLQGYDMIGIAQTGTGKTISFLFPALVHIVGQVTPREKRVGPTALILAPTRELAQQIEAEAKKYTYKGIKSICIYGGGSRRNQINLMTKGIDIVIATPGRLNDLCMSGIVDVSGVTYLVLDEADRMLDMGFEPQIRKIVIDIREDRQTVMTSATWTGAIQELATRYMTKPFKVNIGAFDLAAVHSVTQEIIFGEDDYDDRRKLLDEFIDSMGPDDKAIVFVEKKAIVDDISSDLNLRGIEVQSIHGDREQCDREQALDDLKTGYMKILIATDVASRGIDIKDITLIFNLYFPRNIEEYVHRVGRTGRAGRTGKAISVITRKDWNHAADLIGILEEADQYVPDELYDMAARYKVWKDKKIAEDRAAGGRRSGRGGRNRY